MKLRHKWIILLFPASVFFMMFDFLPVHPDIPVSVYRIAQVVILFMLAIFLMNRNPKFSLNNPTFLLLIGFLLIVLVASPFSVNVNNSLFEAFRLAQFTILAFIMSLFLKSVWKEEYWIYLSTAMLWSGVIAGLSIITDHLAITNFSSLYIDRVLQTETRQFGILGEVNFAAGKLGIFLPFAFLLWRHYNHRGKLIKASLVLIALFVILIAIFLTGSRMGGVIAGFCILVFLFRETRQFLRPRAIFSAVSVVLIIILLVLMSGYHIIDSPRVSALMMRYTQLPAHIATIGEGTTEASIAKRIDFFLIGLKMFADHAVTGVGLGNYPYVIGEYGPWGYKYAHNTFVSILAETGFIGFIFFLGLFVQIGRNIYHYYRNSSYSDFYFYLGMSFISLIIMLLFLSDFGNKYFWGFFVALSIYFDYAKRSRGAIKGRVLP